MSWVCVYVCVKQAADGSQLVAILNDEFSIV